jgi:hypothetical protein
MLRAERRQHGGALPREDDRGEQDDGGERQELERRDGDLETSREPRAEAVDQGQQPEDAERPPHAVRRDEWEEGPERRDHAGRHGDVADPQRNPIGPGDDEADERSERLAAIGIGAAGFGKGSRQPGEDDRQAHRAADREQPAQHPRPAERRQAGGQQIDSRADHVADDERQADPEAEGAGVGRACQ